MSKYINFIEIFGDIIVMSKGQKEPLAKIVYYPRWKQHVLESLGPGPVFNDECLMDIVKKIKSLNEKGRLRIKPERMDHMEIGASIGKPREGITK